MIPCWPYHGLFLRLVFVLRCWFLQWCSLVNGYHHRGFKSSSSWRPDLSIYWTPACRSNRSAWACERWRPQLKYTWRKICSLKLCSEQHCQADNIWKEKLILQTNLSVLHCCRCKTFREQMLEAERWEALKEKSEWSSKLSHKPNKCIS